VFREFKGNVTTNVATHFEAIPGGIFTAADNGTASISTSRVGTYGQFGLGTAAVLGNTGWLGYARVDYRTGENIDGWNVNAGLRYQFSPEPGKRSIKDGPAVAAWSEYNWTGAYLGGFAGRVVGEEDWFTPLLGTSDKPEFGGYLVGGQAGYNVQFGRIVVGIEGDYGFANAKGGKSCTGGVTPFLLSCNAEMDNLALVTGRLGYTWQRALFYAKGGLAVGQATVQTSANTSTVPLFFTGVPLLVPAVNGETKWLTGWTVGGGVEFALTDKWSAKAEYMHFDLGSEKFAIDAPFVADASARGDIVRVGVNYHFHAMRETAPLK
jgi:opacity protein-like surface antigen